MELRDIEYFAVVAQHGHVGRAAEALGLGQPALSMSVRRLEKSVQARLIKRTPKGVELTAVGLALLGHVRRLRLARDNLMRELADLAHGRAGNLRVGTGPAAAETFLPLVCSTVLKDAPKVTLKVTIATNKLLLQALSAGDLDIVVNYVPRLINRDLVVELLWEDEFFVHMSVNHRLAKRNVVTLADLSHERWVMSEATAFQSWQSLYQTFEKHRLPPPEVALVTDSAMLRLRAVASSDLLGFSSRRLVEVATPHARVKMMRVKGVAWTRNVGVVYRKDAYLCPVAVRFIEVLKGRARNNNPEQ